METTNNATVSFNETSVVEETTKTQKDFKQICKDLILTGGKRINDLKVKNINFEGKDNYTRVTFTVNKNIPAYLLNNETMQYELGENNIIFTSLFAIAGMLKEYEDLSWLANTILDNPKALNILFNGSSIDIIQIEYPANSDVINPFSKGEKVTQYDHNVIVNYIVGIKQNETGKQFAMMYAMNVMSGK